MQIRPSARKFSRYHAAVRYLESLENIAGSYQRTNIKVHPRPEIFLERMQDFLDRLGNPEKGMKYVHITGTAGKGSVSSWIHAELVRKGKRAGLFTSPFVTSTIEKIKVGDKLIDPNAFAGIVDELKPHIDASLMFDRHGKPSYFELMQAVAMMYFKKERCEYVVLEVGLGGRYDATNIIKSPLVTAITNIDLDHTAVLGHALTDIADQKAGIIKKSSVFFTTEDRPALLKIFKDTCASVRAEYNALSVKGLDYIERNRLLVGSICKSLGLIKTLNQLVSMPQLPARFEIISQKPLIILDGAHNPSKLSSTIYNLDKLAYKDLMAVVAISSDKKWERMLELLMSRVRRIYFTRFSIPGRQCVSPKLLAEKAREFSSKAKIEVRTDPFQAFADAKKNLKTGDALLVTGSFYLVGDIRSLHCPEEEILKNRSIEITARTA